MNITPVVPSTIQIANTELQKSGQNTQSGGTSFGKVVEKSLASLNELQLNANDSVNQLASGESVELHDVLIAVEEAAISLQLAMQVRNKLLDAYQEISRIQV